MSKPLILLTEDALKVLKSECRVEPVSETLHIGLRHGTPLDGRLIHDGVEAMAAQYGHHADAYAVAGPSEVVKQGTIIPVILYKLKT